jgi:hypothetical protein
MAQESILRKLRNSPGLYLDDDFCAVFLATFKEGKNDYLDGRSVEVASIDESTMWIQELR